ncbi:DUF748 domain-containing protein [Flammeovirga agarivorans]|uniref:DUF748 domain-containing protein n=1 Tax=Flammeovirga agarivorans TaxID=2726742 RepID=A0A7X8XVA8_9BACT|nr:DUF748 domain-containing protein [Flammeovirga agarivorans]NLR91143.1 DUF748 domain-containing protein [Flammeovirga agarivorans]
MSPTKKQSKNIKVTLLILIPLLFFFLSDYTQKKLEDFAANTVKEIALGKNGDGYFVTFNNFNINWFKGKLRATGIVIIPNKEKEKISWINGTVDTVKIKLPQLHKIIFSRNLTVKEVTLTKPNFQFFWKDSLVQKEKTQPKEKQPSKKIADRKSPLIRFSVLGQRLKQIGATSINLTDMKFNGYQITKSGVHKHVFHTSQDLHISGIQLIYDEDKEKNIINVDELAFECGPSFMKGVNELYEYKFDSIVISKEKNIFELKGLDVKPQLSERNFFETVGKQTDMMSLSIGYVSGIGFNADELFDQNKIHLNDIKIDSLQAQIYRDKNYPEDTTVVKNLPNRSIQALNYTIALDKFNVTNSSLTYKEKSKDANLPGEITLTDITIDVPTVNTDSIENIALHLKCKLFGKTPTRIDCTLHTDSTAKNLMDVKGHIDGFPLSYFNTFTHNNAGVVFQEGRARSIDFDIDLYDQVGRGNLDFYYNDLKIKLTGKNDEKSNFVESIANFAANNMVAYKNNNPGPKARHAPLYFKRVQYKSVIHYIIHTIMSGLETSVVGTYTHIPQEERKETKQKYKDRKKASKKHKKHATHQ